MKVPIILLFIFVLYGCTIESRPDKGETMEAPAEEDFDGDLIRFLEPVPYMQLPFSTSCDNEYDAPEYDTELQRKFIEERGEYPYRRIPGNSDLQILMTLSPADILLPIIKTYDKEGKLIASEQLFFNFCGGEPGYYHTEHIRINSNLVIEHIDSSWTYDVNDEQEEIEGTEKLEVVTQNFRILENGEIVKEK